MELRKHPRITPNWPPAWNGTHGPDNPLPDGEVGVLVQVLPASSVLEPAHCVIVMQWNDQEYLASLFFDDEDFLQEVVGFLRTCLGRPIAEIGGLDFP
jgi:hypothetical protein